MIDGPIFWTAVMAFILGLCLGNLMGMTACDGPLGRWLHGLADIDLKRRRKLAEWKGEE